MLSRKKYRMMIEDDLYRVTSEVTDYFVFGVRVFRDQHEVSRRGAEVLPYIRECVKKWMVANVSIVAGSIVTPTWT